jgi:hypothetical protein
MNKYWGLIGARHVMLTLIGLSVTSTLFSAEVRTPVAEHGLLKIVDGKLCSAAGQPVQLKEPIMRKLLAITVMLAFVTLNVRQEN